MQADEETRMATGGDAGLASRIDAAVERALAERRIVGAVVLVAHEGKLVYSRAAGLADRESGRAMEVDAVFRLASITKPYAAAAAMRLVERGTIALDDPVTRYLPDFRPALPDGSRPAISLRQLMLHTSGLGYGFLEEGGEGPYHRLCVSDGLDQPGLSIEENLARLVEAPLLFAPGTSWCYSLGMDVLGAAMESATGGTLDAIIRDEVTGPLGMRDTAFVASDPDRLVTPYANGAEAPVRMEGPTRVPLWQGFASFDPSRVYDRGSYPSGGGGMAGTADDLLRFLEVIRLGDGTFLSQESIAEMRRDQVGPAAQTQGPGWGFGLGWAVLDDPALATSPQGVGTFQWGGAYGHNWFVDPENSLTVVALTNTAFEGMVGQFVFDVRAAVYGEGGHGAGG